MSHDFEKIQFPHSDLIPPKFTDQSLLQFAVHLFLVTKPALFAQSNRVLGEPWFEKHTGKRCKE